MRSYKHKLISSSFTWPFTMYGAPLLKMAPTQTAHTTSTTSWSPACMTHPLRPFYCPSFASWSAFFIDTPAQWSNWWKIWFPVSITIYERALLLQVLHLIISILEFPTVHAAPRLDTVVETLHETVHQLWQAGFENTVPVAQNRVIDPVNKELVPYDSLSLRYGKR